MVNAAITEVRYFNGLRTFSKVNELFAQGYGHNYDSELIRILQHASSCQVSFDSRIWKEGHTAPSAQSHDLCEL